MPDVVSDAVGVEFDRSGCTARGEHGTAACRSGGFKLLDRDGARLAIARGGTIAFRWDGMLKDLHGTIRPRS